MADQPVIRDKEFIEAELSRCNKCGYCMQSCPVYRTNRRELGVARGRNQLLRRVLAEQASISPEEAEAFSECLLCGACTVDCFGKVQTKELMVRAREAYQAQSGQPGMQRYLFHRLLPAPARLTPLVHLAAMGKRSGMSALARRLGLLRWLSPALDVAEDLVPTMPRRFLRERLPQLGFSRDRADSRLLHLEPTHAAGPHVLYFIGCATNYQLPEIGAATARLLAQAGCRVTVAPNNCCGLPPWSYGDLDAAQLLARQNLDLLASLDFDLVVTDCGSCSGFLKTYSALLPDDPRATAVVERTRDLTELLADLKLPRPPAGAGQVTYHDPCHLGRGQGIIEQPRKLLVDAGGFELKELVEADRCCGGGGSYNLTHPRMSREILGRKLQHVGATGAGLVATSCPVCITQLAWGLRQTGEPVPVRHVVQLLAERQGLIPPQ